MSNRTPYYCINESHGGTYTIEPSHPIPHIGTTGCESCVGIYLPINSRKCFVAHINAFVKVATFTAGGPGWTRCSIGLRPSECQSIRDIVKKRLEETAARDGWTADDVVRCLGEGRKKAVVVCPHPDGVGTQPWPHVIKGVEDFSGGRVDLQSLCQRDAMGFIVNHSNGQVETIPASADGWKLEGDRYEQVPTAMNDEEWKVDVGR